MAESVAAPPSSRALKDWFVPCTRIQPFFVDLPRGTFPPGFQQVELVLDEGFSETTWTWEDLYSFTRNKIVWFGPTGYINGAPRIIGEESGDYRQILRIAWAPLVEYDEERPSAQGVVVFCALSAAQGTAACDLCIQSLNCDHNTVMLEGYIFTTPLPVSGRALAQFLAQGDGCVRLKLEDLELEEEHCRVIVSETGVKNKIGLYGCKLTEAGSVVLCQGIRDNLGPKELICCRHLDYILLADALRGNSSINELGLLACTTLLAVGGTGEDGISKEEMCALLRAFAENRGITRLDINSHPFDDDTWDVMCQSLAHHSKLFDLRVVGTLPDDDADDPDQTRLKARLTRRTQALVDMMRVNKVISSLCLSEDEYDEQLFDQEIEPILKLNKYRPRIQRLKRMEASRREPFLGQALHSHSDDTSMMFMLLRGNTDIDWAALRRTRRARKRVRYTK